MTQLFVDGFDHYGTGAASRGFMLSGAWANIGAAVGCFCDTPAWGARTGAYAFRTGTQDDATGQASRITLGGSRSAIIVGTGFSVSNLPENDRFNIVRLKDGSGNALAELQLRSDGVLKFQTPVGTLSSASAAPVIKAETWHYLEMKFDLGAGSVEIRVDGTPVISQTGVVYKDTGGVTHTTVEQVAIGAGTAVGPQMTPWFDDLVIRDTTGTRNNDFEGDIGVAALFLNADTTVAGWTPQPRKKIGTGILDNRAANNSAVTAASSTSTDLGNGDFTIEQFVRFAALPTGSNKAEIFGKWDETNNRRSYQLYLGGPTLDGGNLTFRTSTDGQAGTVAQVISYPWAPDLNRWYHLAISRATGETLLFIDGVQYGLPQADTRTYFAGTAPTAIGGQAEGTGSIIANTTFNGFMDELRLTVGYARYNTTFAPPTVAFPRNVAGDPHFANVALLCGFDNSIADESSYGRLLTARNGSVQNTPDDGSFAYQTINQHAPRDDTFVEAPLLPATGIFTLAGLPLNGETVTVGTTNSPAVTAVYKFVTALAAANDVLIGATAAATISNLVAAITAGAGAGTVYGTGTLVNNDVTASPLPNGQMLASALTPGTAGNSLATTTTSTNGSWGGATLSGGADIPGPSEFRFDRPPPLTTVIKSLTVVTRTLKTDSGTCTVQASLVGPKGTAAAGANRSVTVNPTYYQDMYETDPDTGNDITPTTVVGARVRLNRTT